MIDILILGAGAAGLFCAKWLQSDNYLILEHNTKPAQKIKISGGGRCNITNLNLSIENYFTHHPNLAREILHDFNNTALLSWLIEHGCEPVIRKSSQYFCPQSSQQLIDLLANKRVILGEEIVDVVYENGRFITTTKKQKYISRTILVATGGLSYKKIGASDIGYKIAQKFGHTIAPLFPALVGLTVQKEQFWFKELSGVSMKARVKVGDKEFYDDILFAHRGISGPAILNASLYWKSGTIEIGFLQAFPKLIPHKILSTQLPLPKRFIKHFLQHIGIPDRKVVDLSKEQLHIVRQNLLAFTFAPAGTFGYERAEVTRGGVMLDELDEYLQSKIVPGLFFAGEVCDVTGELGGYNFQWAFSSAKRAAKGINASIAHS